MQFQEFLDQVLPDKGSQATLQFFVGKNIPGSTIKFRGVSPSGKTTMERIITGVFPDFNDRIDHNNETKNNLVNAIYFTNMISANDMIFGLYEEIIANDRDSIVKWAKEGADMTPGELSEIVLNSIIGESK
ncbi:hypothetical protein [Sulfuricurvum sp.]|uniref:hypothetical protein n=1 Tax=Sulfuricurvum sp. TaxID=2025608 RepID=UPI002603A359|nr:hypothetical protein [Sulfuricurvum sp.]MDD2267670.1 hypothetical protein [Sulfuricurvum sp.]MDD2784241.1 hypothetical protein [Sulfuricurvum sp.]